MKTNILVHRNIKLHKKEPNNSETKIVKRPAFSFLQIPSTQAEIF